MSRKSGKDFVASLTGQVWDLAGTIVLVLGAGKTNEDGVCVRCLLLDHEGSPETNIGIVDDWTIRWFDGRSDWGSKRIT